MKKKRERERNERERKKKMLDPREMGDCKSERVSE
jgi:hypothetical protein